ncbi:hypothetical protein [Bacillus sp. NPDC094077]
MIQQQNEMLKQMAKKMDEQQLYIDERLEKRVLLETAASNKKPWWKFW